MVHWYRCRLVIVLLLASASLVSCGQDETPPVTVDAIPTNAAISKDAYATNQAIQTTNTAIVAATETNQAAQASATASSSPPPPPTASASPSPSPSPSATPIPQTTSWYPQEALALFVGGDYARQDLYALFPDGSTELVLENVTGDTVVSPDGRWLVRLRYDQEGSPPTLQLHDAWGGQARIVSPAADGSLFHAAFDRAGERMAYLEVGFYGQEGVPWELVVVDLVRGTSARYADLMSGPEDEPLPGDPLGWSGLANELIIDTFMPYTEGGWAGVWGLSLPNDGASAPLDDLNQRQLVDQAPAYFSEVKLSPDGDALAYLGRNTDYSPQDYSVEYIDMAVNRLETVDLKDGGRQVLIEVKDGSALAGDTAWSSDGQRLLFAQGFYQGTDFAQLALKSVGRTAASETLDYGNLTLPDAGGMGRLAWCQDTSALYTTWDYQGMNHLYLLDLETGESTQFATHQVIEIVGCAP